MALAADARAADWRCAPLARNRSRPTVPAFEAATVRPNTSGETRRQIEVLPGGRFNAINMTLWQILAIAYPVDGTFPATRFS